MLKLISLGLFATSLLASANPACQIQAYSTTQQQPLVELYTSEGCSSCPPADYWLAGLYRAGVAPRRVVALAFHVDYWDHIGWRDRFSNPRWSERQQVRAVQNRLATVFTPQVLLNGSDSSNRPDEKLRQWLTQVVPAPVTLELHARPAPKGTEVGLEVQPVARSRSGKVYLALYENNLSTQVKAGENGGVTLHHDGVVRTLLGPWSLDAKGRLSQLVVLPWAEGQRAAKSGIAAWVEDEHGQVMQAMAVACDS